MQQVLGQLSSLNQRVCDSQDNVIAVWREISVWEQQPLYTRGTGGTTDPSHLLDLASSKARREKRFQARTSDISQPVV